MDRDSVEYEVYPILVHMANTENWTPDLLILSSTPYPHHAPINIEVNKLWNCVNSNSGIHLFQPDYLEFEGASGNVSEHHTSRSSWLISRTELTLYDWQTARVSGVPMRTYNISMSCSKRTRNLLHQLCIRAAGAYDSLTAPHTFNVIRVIKMIGKVDWG